MNDLVPIFDRLGLLPYLDAFIEEGFDSWELVQLVTESDLEKLNVKLAHRRKLQNEIASARGMSYEQYTASSQSRALSESRYTESDGRLGHKESDKGKRDTSQHPLGTTGTKRKYRRHPKPDENAPERPPSAYVLFSNKIRDEIKHQKMSFTEIAKTVGEKWQLLTPEEKEPFEKDAMTAKEKYSAAMTQYKQTDTYQEYARYLADFKAKNAPTQIGTEGKRLKTETSIGSTASSASGGSAPPSTFGHERPLKDSPIMTGTSPSLASVNSPMSTASRAYVGRPMESPPPLQAPSSHSPTPFPTHRSASAPQEGLLTQRGPDVGRPTQLPRISSLDARDPSIKRVTLAPLLTDPAHEPHPRRSNATPPTFVRNDTSKSSVASTTFSHRTADSSEQTPVTPDEASRMFPLPALNAPYGNITTPTAAPFIDQPRTFPFGPTAPGHTSSYSGSSMDRGPEQSKNMSRLSIGENVPNPPVQLNLHIAQIQNQAPGPSLRRSPTQGPSLQPTPAQPTTQSASMDPLSVLALAGRMVEGESHAKKEQP